MKNGLQQVLSYLPEALQTEVQSFPCKEELQEIRLRNGRKASVSMGGKEFSLTYAPSPADLEGIFRSVCEYSVHSFQREIAGGYLTLRGGNRVGFCGTAVTDGNRVDTIREISSMNFRIAREVTGCADELMKEVFSAGGRSALIVSPPAGGKTTLLRDLCRQIGNREKTSLIDERGEIAAVYRGVPQNDVGRFTDVLDGYPKAEGMLIALRVLSPRYIFLDELGGNAEISGVAEALFAGARVIATVHASSKEELCSRKGMRGLLKTGAFSHLVFLSGGQTPGRILRIEEAVSR